MWWLTAEHIHCPPLKNIPVAGVVKWGESFVSGIWYVIVVWLHTMNLFMLQSSINEYAYVNSNFTVFPMSK